MDIVILTSSLSQSSVRQLSPIVGSDHLAQMINLFRVTIGIADLRHGKIKKTRFNLMSSILSFTDRSIVFVGYTNVDSCTAVFMWKLNRALAQSTSLLKTI